MQKPFKIMHIITGLNTGGAEQVLFNLLQGGLAGSFDCQVVSLMDKGTIGPRIEALGVPVTCLGMRRGIPSPLAISKLKAVAQEFKPGIIQGWMYHGNLAATIARFFAPGNPDLAWNIRHSLYDIGLEKRLTQVLIRISRFMSIKPEKILYNSQISRQQHEIFGFSDERGMVIPNGIDINRYKFSSAARQRVRNELGIPSKAKVVGHVARFHPMKDHALFLQAAVEIARRYDDVYFLMVGRKVTWENDLFTRLIPAGLQSRFHPVGERRDVAELMSAMDISSSSSYGEGFPNVLGEAMAVGLPCVATDVGDCRLIIGDTGELVRPRDLQGFINILMKLLDMPGEKRRWLGQKARDRIVNNFALPAIVKQYEQLYRELIEKNLA